MERVLIAGCSFVAIEALYPLPPWDEINYRKYTFRGDVAAGNQAIAARVQHEVTHGNFDHVVVLWSGINRIDIPVAVDFHRNMPKTYRFIADLQDPIWYLSGGIAGSWQWDDICPDRVKNQFRDAFLHQTHRSASDTTLQTIADLQQWLAQRGISYDMSFIYDIHRDYNDRVDYENNRRKRVTATDRWPQWLALEHCLGQVDTTSPAYDQVDWAKCRSHDTVYEWCESRNLLQADRFHPTKDGFRLWLDQVLNINLSS
jgi:hypothetical protein